VLRAGLTVTVEAWYEEVNTALTTNRLGGGAFGAVLPSGLMHTSNATGRGSDSFEGVPFGTSAYGKKWRGSRCAVRGREQKEERKVNASHNRVHWCICNISNDERTFARAKLCRCNTKVIVINACEMGSFYSMANVMKRGNMFFQKPKIVNCKCTCHLLAVHS